MKIVMISMSVKMRFFFGIFDMVVVTVALKRNYVFINLFHVIVVVMSF